MSEDKSLFESAQSVLDLAVKGKHAVSVGDWDRDKFEEACACTFLLWTAAVRPRGSDEQAWDSFFEAAWRLLDDLKDADCVSAETWVAFRASAPVWGLKEKGEADG